MTAIARVLPDAIIVGAQRCGTTSFFRYMKQHPQIVTSPWKEVHYFDREVSFAKGPGWYRAHFPTRFSLARKTRADGLRRVTLEGTPAYLYRPAAAPRMAALVPNARLIVLLRDPAKRAPSNYRNAKRKGRTDESFAELVAREQAWLAAGSPPDPDPKPRHLLRRGMYVEQLEHLFGYYPREQVLILESEKMYADPQASCDQAFEFLGLPPHPIDSGRVHNKTKSKTEVDDETRERMAKFFAPYNRRLEQLLGRQFEWSS